MVEIPVEEGIIDNITKAAEETEEELSEETVDTEMKEHEDKEEKEEMNMSPVKNLHSYGWTVPMIEAMDHKKKKEEMSEEAQETKEELSAETVEPIKHNPEAEQNNKVNFKISGNRQTTTMDRVYSKIFNNN